MNIRAEHAKLLEAEQAALAAQEHVFAQWTAGQATQRDWQRAEMAWDRAMRRRCQFEETHGL